jgi:hypothetical protein
LSFQLSYDIIRLMRAVIDGLMLISKLCYNDRRLQCLDPPIFTSPMLRRLQYKEYDLRRLWRVAKKRSMRSRQSPIVIYDCCGAHFEIVSLVRHEPAYHHKQTMTPVDLVDCRILGEECLEVTHSNKFYIYIQGRIEDNYLKINVAHLIALVARSSPDELETMLSAARRFLEADTHEKLELVVKIMQTLSKIISEREHIITAILPKIPQSLEELSRVSPIVREMFKELLVFQL